MDMMPRVNCVNWDFDLHTEVSISPFHPYIKSMGISNQSYLIQVDENIFATTRRLSLWTSSVSVQIFSLFSASCIQGVSKKVDKFETAVNIAKRLQV